jgi:L-ascorbate metabolism protein UlaG (beta-lactamase superfamily)
MKIRLIRKATLRLTYAGQEILTDPYLAAKFSRPSYTGKSPNPLVDLPCPAGEVIAGIDRVFISHLHSDHFDPAAAELLPKDTSIYCQPGEESSLMNKGFQKVTPVVDNLKLGITTIVRTTCQHGSGNVLEEMGPGSGYIFQAKSEPTVYWCGDTVWNETIAENIHKFQPQIIITHSCGAVWGGQVLIVMDAEQTMKVCQAAPASTVVAIHMEALDHATISRIDLRRSAREHGIRSDQLLIPADGESLEFDPSGSVITS